MAALKLGLIGAGAIAQTYAQALERSTTCRLVGVADARPAAAQALAERMRVPAFIDVDELLDATQCEAVVLSTPPASHPELAERLLARGVHVLCEKPLAISPVEARLMMRAAQDSSAVLTMASKFRYVRDMIEAKSILAGGVLGDIILVENVFTARVDMTQRWNSDPTVSGGGVLIDNGTHSVDILRYLLGPLTELHVIEGKRVQNIPVEDTVRVMVRSSSGIPATIDLSWSINKETPHYLSVYGANGTMHIGWKESKFRRAGDQEWTVFGSGYDKIQAFGGQLDNFARSIRGEEQPLITLTDALASVEVIEAAYESLWRDAWVRVGSELSRSHRIPA